jgi:GRAM domain.
LYQIAASARTVASGCYVPFQEPPTQVFWQIGGRESGTALCFACHCVALYLGRTVTPSVFVTDYSCALVGDILLQGRLYITKNYFGFYSNVFGYVTKVSNNLVLREKRETRMR